MISAVVLTYNEEKDIKDCLDSITFVDEIIVIDNASSDKTTKIAKKYTDKIFVKKHNDFSKARNFGLEKAKGDWVLFVDADERVTRKLQEEIKEAIISNNLSGFYLPRLDYFLGRPLKHTEAAKVRLLRLGKKGAGVWERAVHEIWNIKGDVGYLQNPLIHCSHPDIAEFIKKIKIYSEADAKFRFSQGKRSSFFLIFVFPIAKFLKNYIWWLGFLDGWRGFVFSALLAYHSFLIRLNLFKLSRINKKSF